MNSSESSQTTPHQSKSSHLHVITPTSSEQAEFEPEHIHCLAILPFRLDGKFDFYKEIMAPALHKTLEDAPYYWEVITSVNYDRFMDNDKQNKQKNVKVYIVDVSDKNIDMIFELGSVRVVGREKQAIIFVLCDESGTSTQAEEWVKEWTDKKNFHLIQYSDTYKMHNIDRQANSPNEIESRIDELAKSLKQDFLIDTVIELNKDEDRQHYLTPRELCKRCGIESKLANDITYICRSMEVFIKTDPKRISAKLKNLFGHEISAKLISAYQKNIKEFIKTNFQIAK